MEKTKISAVFMIMLVLIIPFYTSLVFAQDEAVVDNTPPSINIKNPPSEVTEPFLDIEGTTNEPVIIETTINSNYYSTLNSNQDNTVKIPITLNEGKNIIEINATDAGENSVVKKFEVYCDSQHPQILYNNIHELSPSYIAKRIIKGTVNKPEIDIEVYVGNKKYTGKSDSKESSEGIYNFEVDIVLERTLHVGATGTVQTQDDNVWQNPIKIVAIDKYGRNSTAEGTIIYTLCGYGSDWDVRTTKITPEVIIPEHLIMGIAQFGFSANLSYLGNADSTKVVIKSPPQITRYDLSQADMEDEKGLIFKERYYQELFSGATPFCNEDNDNCYFVINLNSWPYTREELQNVTFIKIPLRMDIYYEYEDFNGNMVENSQRNCWDISIMVDKEIPVDKIPKNLLNNSINFLNKSINLIDAIRKPIETVKKYTFVACIGSWAVHFIKSISVEFSCVGVKGDAIPALINGDETCTTQSTDDEGNLLDCDACLQNLKELREIEKTRNWICDRIFCPSVPTLEYHKQTYKDSVTKVNICNGEIEGMEGMFDEEDCEEEYKRAWDSAFMMLDEWERATAEENETTEGFFDIISEGLQFCKRANEQTTQVVTIGSGSKQTTYLIYQDGKVCNGEATEVQEGKDTEEGVVVIGQGETQSFYRCDEKGFLDIDDEGYYLDEENKDLEFGKETQDEKNDLKFQENPEEEIEEKDLEYQEETTEKIRTGEKIPQAVQSRRGIEGENNYILDPTSDIIRSVQAVCLPAVSGWLNLWKQILTAVKQCFESIMITGQGSTGVCKAVLTTYVCDIIYDALKCTTDSFALGAGQNATGGLVGFAQKLSTASKEVSDSVSSRYGNTGMFDVMFNQRKLIHSSCLWAFTGDWGQFDLDTMLSAEVGMPNLGSQGLIYPTTRRFIGSNPLEYGRTTYVYHIGAGIIAGSDLNYKVYLKCSNDNSCLEGRCDCFYKGQEEIYNVNSGSLRAGEIYNQEYYIQQPDYPVRYDKAVIEWSWTDNNGQRQTETIVKDLQEKGEGTPEECKLDPTSGEFRCAYIIGKYGDARIVDVLPSNERNLNREPYSIGETINFDITVHVESPDTSNPIPKHVKWSLRDSKNKKLDEGNYEIREDGISEKSVPGVPVIDLCCGGVSDAESIEKLQNYTELKLTISKRPDAYMQFAVIAEGDYYKIYEVTKDDGWKIKDPKNIEEGVYNEEYGIEYNGVTIKIDSDLSDDEEKAAVVVLRRTTKAENCIEGEENMHFKVELYHSKTTEGHEGECCAKGIETEDIKFTVDCNKYDEEENGEEEEENNN